MNRNDFASGKKEEEPESLDKITPKKALANDEISTTSLITDSFINKLNNYIPEKSK